MWKRPFMNATFPPVGLAASLALLFLCGLSTAMNWNAYRSTGGDAAGQGMARGFHDLFRIGLNVLALVGTGFFALSHYSFPSGTPHAVLSVLGWLSLPPTLVLFVILLPRRGLRRQ